jgi:hypothetical protein
MFVNIDMDRLRVLHKHPDHETVSGLSWLECGQHTSIRICNIEADNFLKGIAHGDLCHLYQNVTGDGFQEQSWGDRAEQFRERLREAMRNMPATVAVTEEVATQVDLVDDRLHEGERFKYALGSKIPAQLGELFPLTGKALSQAQTAAADARAVEKARARKEREAAEKRGDLLPQSAGYPGVLGEQLSDPAAPAGTPTAPTEPKLAKARTGSVQPVVFAAAKASWDARASDQTWKQIRDNLYTKLTAEGFHPTTVRIKLSKWAKENEIEA